MVMVWCIWWWWCLLISGWLWIMMCRCVVFCCVSGLMMVMRVWMCWFGV